MILHKVKEPKVIKNVFSDEQYLVLKNSLQFFEKDKKFYDEGFGRYCFNNEVINDFSKKLIPVARKIFASESLIPSYSLFAHYEGIEAGLFKHKDDNACTYTIDLCLYQTEPWDLWVEQKPYTLLENEALAYYGNDQEHWREDFPNPNSQNVAMIFFHFVEPDHWYITEGPSYIEKIRKLV